MKERRTDPVYIAAAGVAVMAGAFYWIPRLGIILAVVTLALCAMGFFRRWKLPGEYGHAWLLIAATVIGVLALVFSIAWTRRLDSSLTMLLIC
jgi:hypothetical protein